MTLTSPIATAAIAWAQIGVPTVPIKGDGSKAPTMPWGDLKPFTVDQATLIYSAPRSAGIAVITGGPARIEMIEFEGRAVEAGLVSEYVAACCDNGLADTLTRVTEGYLEQSPSGGLHLLYQVSDADAYRNLRLARDDAGRVLIETRGDGGYVIVAPTPGECHDTGKPWVLLAGGPDTMATITGEERDALHAVARILDQTPIKPDPAPYAATSGQEQAGEKPGDDYNQRATWDQILTPHGWTRTGTIGAGATWRKPGKRGLGISATTGTKGDGADDRLYVFSTSAAPFDPETPYSKFSAHTLLNHHGDYSQAAKQLRADGYGAQNTWTTTIESTQQLSENSYTTNSHDTFKNATATSTNQKRTGNDLPTPLNDGSSTTSKKLTLDQEILGTILTLEHNDTSTANAFVDNHDGHMRYVADEHRWLHWTGTQWARQPDNCGAITEQFQEWAATLPVADRESTKWRQVVLSTRRTADILKNAQTDPRVHTERADLDKDPYLLGTPDGTINLRTGQLQPPNPHDLITHSTTATPDATMPGNKWAQFLTETFDTPTIAQFMARLIGMSIIGEVRESKLPVLVGSGGNGKSVLVEVITRLMGDYAASAPATFLMATRNPAHETEIARLAGKRIVFASEIEDGARFDEAKVKRLTGGDTIAARFMHQDHFDFVPSHTLFVVGNTTPNVSMGGKALWRRILLIEFPHEVPDHLIDPNLVSTLLRDESSAIMAWIVAGCLDYLTNGLQIPEAVTAASKEYESTSDALTSFLALRCIINKVSPDRVRVITFRDAYEDHCRELGAVPMSPNALSRALKQRHGTATKQSHGVRYYHGVTLLHADDEPDASEQRWTA